jgi:hypothetical protein
MLTFENPPAQKNMGLLTREEIAAELEARPGEWAVVSRPDRVARGESTAERINDGREYGPGYEATVRYAGDRADVRVYARKKKARRANA